MKYLRRILLLSPVVLLADKEKIPVFTEENLAGFHNSYVKFFNKLYGCPPGEVSRIDECRPNIGVFDEKLWEEVCARGQKLFG